MHLEMAAAVDWSSEGVELKHLEMAVAVYRSTETAAVASLLWCRWGRRWIGRQRQRQWRRCSAALVSDDGGSVGSVDGDGGSGSVAVKLRLLTTAAAVDRSTKTPAVASLQWS